MDSVDGNTGKVNKNVLPCTLDNATKKLIELVFSQDMFREAMECMNLGGCVSFNQPPEQTCSSSVLSLCKYMFCNMAVLLECPFFNIKDKIIFSLTFSKI